MDEIHTSNTSLSITEFSFTIPSCGHIFMIPNVSYLLWLTRQFLKYSISRIGDVEFQTLTDTVNYFFLYFLSHEVTF